MSDISPRPTPEDPTPGNLTRMTEGRFPGLLGFKVVEADALRVVAEFEVRPELLAPNGHLHAAAVVALADTACGIGCRLSLPEGSVGFATAQVSTDFVGTARQGTVRTVAELAHGGRRMQVWTADVLDADGRRIAMFRCTQLITWPR